MPVYFLIALTILFCAIAIWASCFTAGTTLGPIVADLLSSEVRVGYLNGLAVTIIVAHTMAPITPPAPACSCCPPWSSITTSPPWASAGSSRPNSTKALCVPLQTATLGVAAIFGAALVLLPARVRSISHGRVASPVTTATRADVSITMRSCSGSTISTIVRVL